MKTFRRILAIVAAFVLVMGIVYFAVNAGSSSSNAPVFDRGGGFQNGNPQFRGDGQRPEFRGEGERGGGGWIFGMIKNIGIVAAITALIAVPKNWAQKKRQAVPVPINN